VTRHTVPPSPPGFPCTRFGQLQSWSGPAALRQQIQKRERRDLHCRTSDGLRAVPPATTEADGSERSSITRMTASASRRAARPPIKARVFPESTALSQLFPGQPQTADLPAANTEHRLSSMEIRGRLWHSHGAEAGHTGHASRDAGWGGESSRRSEPPAPLDYNNGSFGDSRIMVASHGAPMPLGPKTAQEILSAQTPKICNMPAQWTVRGLSLVVISWNVFRSALSVPSALGLGVRFRVYQNPRRIWLKECVRGVFGWAARMYACVCVCVCGSLVSLAITELEKATCVLSISVYAVGLVTSFTLFSAPKVSTYVLAASFSLSLSLSLYTCRARVCPPSPPPARSAVFRGNPSAPQEPWQAAAALAVRAKCATHVTDTYVCTGNK
jgi:hypothetical protein